VSGQPESMSGHKFQRVHFEDLSRHSKALFGQHFQKVHSTWHVQTPSLSCPDIEGLTIAVSENVLNPI
jgi:hypothetical protein